MLSPLLYLSTHYLSFSLQSLKQAPTQMGTNPGASELSPILQRQRHLHLLGLQSAEAALNTWSMRIHLDHPVSSRLDSLFFEVQALS